MKKLPPSKRCGGATMEQVAGWLPSVAQMVKGSLSLIYPGPVLLITAFK